MLDFGDNIAASGRVICIRAGLEVPLTRHLSICSAHHVAARFEDFVTYFNIYYFPVSSRFAHLVHCKTPPPRPPA